MEQFVVAVGVPILIGLVKFISKKFGYIVSNDTKLILAPVFGALTTVEPFVGWLTGAGLDPLTLLDAIGFGAAGTWVHQAGTKSRIIARVTQVMAAKKKGRK